MPDIADPDLADPEADEPDAASPSRRGPVVVLAVAAGVFAVIALLAVLVAISARKDSDQNKEQLTVRTTASRVAEALVALDATGDGTEHATVIHSLGTGPFIAQYDEGADKIRQLYSALKITATGVVKDTYLSQIDGPGNEATVIVTVSLVITGQQTTPPIEHYLQVHLVKLGGSWKVDNVTDINTQLAASGTATTVPTTAPAPATPTTAN